MRTLLSALALLSLVAAGGCGAPSLTCQTTTCSGNSNMYQVCTNINATETYNFGGMSCNCSVSNCTSCAQMVAAYCGAGAGGTGGSGGGGTGGSGGGGSQCTITLTGAVTGTFTCTNVTTYDAGSNTAAMALVVNTPAPLQQLTVAVSKPGMPMTGAWSSSDAGAKGGVAVQQMPVNNIPPTWTASTGNGGANTGSWSANVTVTNNGGGAYTSTGTLTATLAAANGTGAMGAVNLSATF
jgi:hypothetical protein